MNIETIVDHREMPHAFVLQTMDRQHHVGGINLASLIGEASESDLEAARESLRLIQLRGFNRSKDLLAEFETLLHRRLPLGSFGSFSKVSRGLRGLHGLSPLKSA